ncbi:MAG: GNAT family N-acetyltransferase [Bacteroidetes bacterium]|nr:GNAT family N-acetyltransferase [Bacteroidota bacterium]
MTMYVVEHLAWDSEHFGRRTGRIRLPGGHDRAWLGAGLRNAVKDGYGMIYLFAPGGELVDPKMLERHGGRKMPSTVLFERKVPPAPLAHDPSIAPYTGEARITELMELAYICGAHSRFKVDPGISDGQYRAMYETWLARSVKRELADEVFVYKMDGALVGLITVSVNDGVGRIGLLSVSPGHQGEGIGGKLLGQVFQYLAGREVWTLQVPTQAENVDAMRFYGKKGFHIIEVIDVYHLFPNGR